MKKNKNPALILVCLSAFLLITSCDGSNNGGGHSKSKHAPIVQDLVDILSTDPALRDEVKDVLNQQDEGSFWHGKTLEDMYDFFDEWLLFLPTPENARQYMDIFYEFTESSDGRAVVLQDSFTNWLYEFMLARGRFMDSEDSSAALPWWLCDPEIQIEDYIVPEGGFTSFNNFFTRQIKPELRPIASPDNDSVLTSPADSTVMKISEELTAQSIIQVKGDGLYVEELLGGDDLAGAFMNGRAVLCMLATTNYHRFHSPVQGEVVSEGQLGGLYYGMTGGWVDYFFEHRRGYFIFDTDEFGLVGMVCVGMFTISSIEFVQSEGDFVMKGDELGHFAYGGSAIILLFEPDRVAFSIPIDQRPVEVLMGEAIGSSVPQS